MATDVAISHARAYRWVIRHTEAVLAPPSFLVMATSQTTGRSPELMFR
jgi:hypothetical protein